MSIVKTHPAYEEIKNAGLITILCNELMSRPNYGFEDFVTEMPELAAQYVQKLKDFNVIKADEVEDKVAKTKGNLFELFTMFTLQYFETNSRIGVEKGTYEQIPDEEDCGLDFCGHLSFNGSRVFGQIKFRTQRTGYHSFDRTAFHKLYGTAGSIYDFDKSKDYLMLVTNQKATDAIAPALQRELGGCPKFDFKHSYVKFIDYDVFNSLIDANHKRFWTEFAKEF